MKSQDVLGIIEKRIMSGATIFIDTNDFRIGGFQERISLIFHAEFYGEIVHGPMTRDKYRIENSINKKEFQSILIDLFNNVENENIMFDIGAMGMHLEMSATSKDKDVFHSIIDKLSERKLY